jgi:uncharacterized membrane protein YdcZ (DUF606 family)
MERVIVFVLGMVAAMVLIVLMGARPQGFVNKYQISAWGTADGMHGVYVVDSSTGVVWEVHRSGEIDYLGRSFEDPRRKEEYSLPE